MDKAQAASVPQFILSLIVVPEDQLLLDLSQIWAALVLLPHLRQELHSLLKHLYQCVCLCFLYLC